MLSDWEPGSTRSCKAAFVQKNRKDHFKHLLFLCGLRDFCYSDVRLRIFYIIEQNHDKTLQDLGDECRGMDAVLDETAMTHQNEHGYARRIEKTIQKEKHA